MIALNTSAGQNLSASAILAKSNVEQLPEIFYCVILLRSFVANCRVILWILQHSLLPRLFSADTFL